MSVSTRIFSVLGILLLVSGSFWAFSHKPAPNVPDNERQSQAIAEAPGSGRPLPIRVGDNSTPVTPAARATSLDYAGVTLPNRTVTIVSETQGRIVQVLARNGQAVQQGQAFAVADSQLKKLAVTTAQAQLTQAQRQLEQARKQADRLGTLAAERNASAVEFEQAQSQLHLAEAQLVQAQAQLEQAQRQLTDATVRIPTSGILTERTAEPGSVLQPGTELGKVVDISTLKVRIYVPEQEVFTLRLGQTARLQPDALPGLTLMGRITLIGIVADDVRNFPVELTLANPNRKLKAGQSVKVSF